MTDKTDAWPLWSADDEPPPPGLIEWTPGPGVPPPGDPASQPAAGTQATAPGTPEAEAKGTAADTSTVKLRPSRRPTCLECGGNTDDDGYCERCGARVPTPREHFESAPNGWVGGVCDRGVVHPRNEDAMALWAAPDPEVRAVLVVCDGVSSSSGSDVAALAAAEKAREVLVAAHPDGLGVQASHDAAMAEAMTRAAAEANAAVVADTAPDSPNAAACTFAAAVVHDTAVHYGNLGDSRIYWIGETTRVQLSTDHSMAEELIQAGQTRIQAETSDQAHAITKWLGKDADDIVPTTGSMVLDGPGWVVVCSDGLWNYASEPSELAAQLDAALAAGDEPVAVAGRLVAWANAQGGKDNITVALARVPATLQGSRDETAKGS